MTKIAYKCTGCGVENVKLWRQYQTFADNIKLMCVDCSCQDQKFDAKHVSEKGYYTYPDDDKYLAGITCDQLGWLVPACPTADGETFWGYTSVPEDIVVWWRDLPLRSNNE
jgi:hypothetical protein